MTLAEWIRILNIPGYGDDEVEFIGNTMRQWRPTCTFDWGTNVGSSTRILYEAAQLYGFLCEIHTTELPDTESWKSPEHPGQRYGQQLQNVPVHLHRGDGVEVSLNIYQSIQTQRALFFVDGDHGYESLAHELTEIAKRAPTAVILCHDVRHLPECARAFDEFTEAYATHYHSAKLLSQAGLGRLQPC